MYTDLIVQMFDAFSSVITGLAGGIKDAFLELIYLDPAATTPEFNPLVVFLFVAGGLALAFGIFYKVFGMIRGVSKS